MPKEFLSNYLRQRVRRFNHALHATPGVLPYVSAAPELMKRYRECRKGVGLSPSLFPGDPSRADPAVRDVAAARMAMALSNQRSSESMPNADKSDAAARAHRTLQGLTVIG